MFTLLCLFCKDTPNYVNIDVKRTPSDLALGQWKMDLKSMDIWLKMNVKDVETVSTVYLYIIRLVLMGQRCLYYFVVTLDQKAITTNETNAS